MQASKSEVQQAGHLRQFRGRLQLGENGTSASAAAFMELGCRVLDQVLAWFREGTWKQKRDLEANADTTNTEPL